MKNKCYFTNTETNLKTVHILEDDRIVGLILISKDIELKSIEKNQLKHSLKTIQFHQSIDKNSLFTYQGLECIYIGTYVPTGITGDDAAFNGYSLFKYVDHENNGWTCYDTNLQAINAGAMIGESGYYWIKDDDRLLIKV